MTDADARVTDADSVSAIDERISSPSHNHAIYLTESCRVSGAVQSAGQGSREESPPSVRQKSRRDRRRLRSHLSWLLINMTYSRTNGVLPAGTPYALAGTPALPSMNGEVGRSTSFHTVTHPDDTQIELFILDSRDLREDARERVEEHLKSCDPCRRVAGKLLEYYMRMEALDAGSSDRLRRFLGQLWSEDSSEPS